MSSSSQIPNKMRGLLLERFVEGKGEDDPYSLRDDIPFDASSLKPTDVVIRAAVAGVCHTDIMTVRGEMKRFLKDGLPIVPSHEPTGVVVAMGSEAAAKSEASTGGKRALKEGDRVVSFAHKDYCGECDECKAGRQKFCSKTSFLGISNKYGGLAEYLIADYRSVAVLPNEVSFETGAPLACAGLTIYTAIKGVNLKRGQHVAIVGAGALGHIGCQLAKSMGLRTSVLDARDAPLELCNGLRLKPDATFNCANVDANKEEEVAKVVKAIGGEPDATIVTTDAIPAFSLAINITKMHGQMQVVGQPADPIPSE